MNITRTSIERPKLVVVTITLIFFLGVAGLLQLNYELTPKFTPPVITVVTVYPGASALEVESGVSRVVEDALSSLENVETITAYSRENFSLVRLELVPGSDVDLRVQDASRKLLGVAGDLPEGAGNPVINRFDFDDLPVMRIGAFSDLNPVDFYDFAVNRVQPALARLEGVAQVNLTGGRPREIRVHLDPDRLNAYGVPLMQVVQAVNMANMDVPAGTVANDSEQTFLRLSGRFKSVEALKDLVVYENLRQRITVRLRQVADVFDTEAEPSAFVRIDGRYALGIEIRKQSDANAVEVSKLTRENLRLLEDLHMDIGLAFSVAQDTSLFTIEAAQAVMTDLGLAVLLVSLIMLVFLHSLRNSLIVLVSIPTSIIATFIVMYVLGYTLNLLTLLGLSLAIGILVDDSIVVVENIYRHIEMRKSRVRAAYDGRIEIGFTAISITLIDVVVFLPIVFAEGMVADLLRQFSVVVVSSTLMSLFVSFTLVPLLASRFAKLQRLDASRFAGNLLLSFENAIDRFVALITGSLDWAFDHKGKTIMAAAVMLIGSLSLVYFGFIGIEFTKAGDRSEFIIELEMPPDATLQQTNRATLAVERYLMGLREVQSVFSTVGATTMGSIEANTSNLAEISVELVDKKDRVMSASELGRLIKLHLEGSIPGLRLRPIEINLIGLRDDDDVEVTIIGSDQSAIRATAGEVVQVLETMQGVVEIQSSEGERFREYSVDVDRRKMEMLGVNMAHVAAVLRNAFSGNRDAKYQEGGLDYDINVIMDPHYRRSREDIGKIAVTNNMGQIVRIEQFADIVEEISAAQLERTNRAASVTIKAQVVGRPAGTVGGELKSRMEDMQIPEGVTYQFGGQTKRTTDGIRTMLVAFAISVLLVYLILVALYDSYYYPFVVLFSIPLAIIGALLALALTQQSLSIFSILGMVILIGLVGKNAILVVDFTNNLKQRGMDLRSALIEATRLRFRPILMTNITMVLGLLPIALASGAGSEWKNGLAWALIGGLSSSMLLTLVVVPVIYYTFDVTLSRYGIEWGSKVKVRTGKKEEN
jgi:hydrophobe/amphiphile efflux-1 (HAE1) family protein